YLGRQTNPLASVQDRTQRWGRRTGVKPWLWVSCSLSARGDWPDCRRIRGALRLGGVCYGVTMLPGAVVVDARKPRRHSTTGLSHTRIALFASTPPLPLRDRV